MLEEVVAFANAHGGVLVVGIAESQTEKDIAESIEGIPKCVELSARFKQIYDHQVEPPIPSLEIRGVKFKEDGSGVLVIRTGKSRLAPHRVKSTKECTIRRQVRCEKLSMREIQDLTLNTNRGLERIESRFLERSKKFKQEFKRLATPEKALGIKITGIAIDEGNYVDRIFKDGRIDGKLTLPYTNIWRRNQTDSMFLDWIHPLLSGTYRPVLRGARTESRSDQVPIERCTYAEVMADGLVELGFLFTSK